MHRFLFIYCTLLIILLPVGLSAQLRVPPIVTPEGHPAHPVPFQLKREHWDLRGPVKQTSEYSSTADEEEKKMYYDRTTFNAQGWVELDEVGGPYGYRRSFQNISGNARYGDFQLKLNASGQPLTAASTTTGSSYSYKADLLTGINTIYRERIESMDGSSYVSSAKTTLQYNYDGAGRLTREVKVVDEKEVYRINYYYNAAGQLDSLSESGSDLPLIRYTFSYKTENGNQVVNYEEKNSNKYSQDRARGYFVFTPQGRLLSESHSRKKDMLLRYYTLDSNGNWTKKQERFINETYKDWQTATTLRTITYF